MAQVRAQTDGDRIHHPVLQALLKLQPFFGKAQADKFTAIVKLIGQCSW